MRQRRIGIVLITLTLLLGGGYTGWRILRASATGGPPLDLGRAGTFLYLDNHQVHQAHLIDPTPSSGTGPSCLRAYASSGTLVCLRTGAAPDATKVVVYDSSLTERKSLSQWGVPSRARVSPSGRLIAWTVFRTGDSYLAPNGGFSTTAGVYDLKTEAYYGSLEDFTTIVDGRVYEAVDRNFWGITFAADDNTFYATLGSAGRTWLLRGDLTSRRLEALRENVECPSLSPDGRRIGYKKRFGDLWRLHVLDLATGRDTPLAETAHIDDQVTWLDGDMIGYARDGAVWVVPADGSGNPRRLSEGSSPSPA